MRVTFAKGQVDLDIYFPEIIHNLQKMYIIFEKLLKNLKKCMQEKTPLEHHRIAIYFFTLILHICVELHFSL